MGHKGRPMMELMGSLAAAYGPMVDRGSINSGWTESVA
jgi:hypothetical protein